MFKFITGYDKCICGAYSIEVTDLRTDERKKVNFKGTLKNFIKEFRMGNDSIGSKLRWNKRPYSCCDYCANHWGLDLCGCGSGEKYRKCKQCSGEYGVAQSLDEGFVSSCDSNLGAGVKFG